MELIALMEAAQRLLQEGQPFAFATVIGAEGSTPRHLGAKMIVRDDGAIVGTIGGGNLEAQVIERAREALAAGVPVRVDLSLGPSLGQCCGGRVEVLIEPCRARDRLYLFGAGHVGQALARAAAPLGFELTVIDPRPDWNSGDRFPAEASRLLEDGPEAIGHLPFDDRRTYCAVMTHSHRDDEEVVRLLLDRPVRYLGLIGSKTKWARFRQRYLGRGIAEERLARVRCPVGLELAAETPEEIAVSIVAELVKVRRAHLALVAAPAGAMQGEGE
jgi:xanthine dehydrogenase accessory factor